MSQRKKAVTVNLLDLQRDQGVVDDLPTTIEDAHRMRPPQRPQDRRRREETEFDETAQWRDRPQAQHSPQGAAGGRYPVRPDRRREEDVDFGDARQGPRSSQRYPEQRAGESRYGEGRGDFRFGEGRGDFRFGEGRVESRFGETRSGEPRFGEGRGESRFGETRSGEPRFGEGRGESRFGETRSGEPRFGEGRSGEPRFGEGRPGEARRPSARDDDEADFSTIRQPKSMTDTSADKRPEHLKKIGKGVKAALQKRKEAEDKPGDVSDTGAPETATFADVARAAEAKASKVADAAKAAEVAKAAEIAKAAELKAAEVARAAEVAKAIELAKVAETARAAETLRAADALRAARASEAGQAAMTAVSSTIMEPPPTHDIARTSSGTESARTTDGAKESDTSEVRRVEADRLEREKRLAALDQEKERGKERLRQQQLDRAATKATTRSDVRHTSKLEKAKAEAEAAAQEKERKAAKREQARLLQLQKDKEKQLEFDAKVNDYMRLASATPRDVQNLEDFFVRVSETVTDGVAEFGQLKFDDENILNTFVPTTVLAKVLLCTCSQHAKSEDDVRAIVDKFVPLLVFFFGSNTLRRHKLRFLAETQRFVFGLGAPSVGENSYLIENVWDSLYLTGVVEEQYFLLWSAEEDAEVYSQTDDMWNAGRTKILFQLIEWLRWLRQSTSEGMNEQEVSSGEDDEEEDEEEWA